MKYIIMAGGNYKDKFKTPKQLMKVNNEVVIERTIRLLKENGVKDIYISTNNPEFYYLEIPILSHKNNFKYGEKPSTITRNTSWLNAYYPIKEPCCYLHGDVYYSEEAIKTIVETKVEDTMFFCVQDIQDGRKTGINSKGREPLAYKVQNQEIFRKAINELFDMIDIGLFKNGVEPISWHLYRQINGLELGFNAKDYGFANNIFKTNGDYIVIEDYTTDIDSIEDIKKLENMIKIVKGVKKMIKVRVTEKFHLGKFNELKNIKRYNPSNKDDGYLYQKDEFECTREMADYLLGGNALGRKFIEIIEVIPEKTKTEAKENIKPTKKTTIKKTETKKTTRKSIAKKQ